MDDLLNTLASLDIQLRRENGTLKCNAPAGVMSPDIRERIAAHKEELLAHFRQQEISSEPDGEHILPVSRDDGIVPLSFSQRRLLVLEEFAGVGAAYILPAVLRLRGSIQVNHLRAALGKIITRHEVLRTLMRFDEGSFCGSVVSDPEIPLSIIDLQGIKSEQQQREIERNIDLTIQTPFELSKDLPLRTSLIKIREAEYVFIVAFHHSVADGWSIGIFQRELAAFYNELVQGGAGQQEPLKIQYADYAAWQQQRFSGVYRERKGNYWKKELEGSAHTLNFPTDKPRPALQTFNGSSVLFDINRETTSRLKEVSAKGEATLFMTLLAGYGVFLSRSCTQDDILVGIPMHNRLRQEFEALIGYFSDTVPVRLQLAGNPTFLDLLSRIRTASIGAYENQDIPFDEVVNAIQPERDLSRNPLVQVMFALQNAPLHGPQPQLELHGAEVEAIEVNQQFIRLDLEMHLWETYDGLKGMLFYNTDLFDRHTAEKMCARYCRILQTMAANPDERISQMVWLDRDEHHQITQKWNATGRSYSDQATLHEQFHSLAVADPAALAIVSGDDRLTREELDSLADRIAGWLRRSGVKAGDKVGIFTGRTWCSIAAMLGILKANGVYVPVDSGYPAARRDLMINDAGVRCILTESSFWDSVADWWHGPFLSVDSDQLPTAMEKREKGDPDALCYIIYTSGSTGIPKGVRVRHRAVINMVEAICAELKPSSDEVWTVFHSHSFDLSVWEIWGGLLSGGTLVMVDAEVARDPDAFYTLAVREQVTLLSQTPTALEQFAPCHEEANKKIPLRHIGCGGESFPSKLAERVLKWNIPVWNFYGPTEATVWASVHRVGLADLQQATVPIGHPFANMRMYILDEYGNPLPPNSPGELCIGGVGVACGYHNRPELTEEKFTENPFDLSSEHRLYHTGDLARFAHDGTISVLGRMDRQAKIRGFRIEPGEIEYALCALAPITQAVVVLRDDDGDSGIIAYIVAEKDAPDDETLRIQLRERLPEYMIPQAIVRLEKLPVSHNGKIDIAALPPPDQTRSARDYKAPRTKTEKLLASMWSEVLGRKRVGVDDNLFDIGVNSLLVVQVQRKLQSSLSNDLVVTDFFRYPTIGALAAYLANAEQRPSESSPTSPTSPVSPENVNNPAEQRSAARKKAMQRQQQVLKQSRRRNV